MQLKNIELDACKNKPLPKFLTLPETCLYISLRYLYKSYHKGEISKENATAEKHKLLAEYERFEKAYSDWCKLCSDYQDNIRKAGTMLSDIEKSDNTEDMAVLACEVVGIMIGDENFASRQKKKITGGKND